MGKTSALFASSLPRLPSGIVFSADSGFRVKMTAEASEREYVDRETALLRAHVVFKLSEKTGVGVEHFSFGLFRFCAVEPSYVVVLAPMLDDQIFDECLMPLTKQEKQLMVSKGCGPFPDPAVASWERERILPFIRGSMFLHDDAGERFVRHAGHITEEVNEEYVQAPDGSVRKGFSVRRVITGGYFLYCLYAVSQFLTLMYVIGSYEILMNGSDPVENTWGFIFEPFRVGARYGLTVFEQLAFFSAEPDLTDWVAWRAALFRAYKIFSCKYMGGCVTAVAQAFNAGGDHPFMTDALTVVTSAAFVTRVIPTVFSMHYKTTMILADKALAYLPSSPTEALLSFSFPNVQRLLFGTFFYAALCAGELDLSCFDELLDTETWRSLPVPWGDVPLSLLFYQDDIFVWDEHIGNLEKKIALVSEALLALGLELAKDKTQVIASQYYRGPRTLQIGGERVDILPAKEQIRVVGVNFSFYDGTGQQAKDLLPHFLMVLTWGLSCLLLVLREC